MASTFLFLVFFALMREADLLKQCDSHCKSQRRSPVFPCYTRANNTVCCDNCYIKMDELSSSTDKHSWRSLELSRTGLHHLTAETFAGFDSLQELDVSDNYNLQEIDPDAFHGLKNLKFLNISMSKLCMNWTINNPQDFVALTELDISRFPRRLQLEDYDDCYKDLLHNTVASLPSLSKLHISYFYPLILPAFQNFSQLKIIFEESIFPHEVLDILDTSFKSVSNISNLHIISNALYVKINIKKNAKFPFKSIQITNNYTPFKDFRYRYVHQGLSRNPGLNGSSYFNDFFTHEYGYIYIPQEFVDWKRRHSNLFGMPNARSIEFSLQILGDFSLIRELVSTRYTQIFERLNSNKMEFLYLTLEFGLSRISSKETSLFNATDTFSTEAQLTYERIKADFIKFIGDGNHPLSNCYVQLRPYSYLRLTRAGDSLSLSNLVENTCTAYVDYHIKCDTFDRSRCNSTEIRNYVFGSRNPEVPSFLRYLSLSDTPIGSLILGDQSIATLRYLNISNCGIDVINPEFLKLPHLNTLDISKNPLKFCTDEALEFCLGKKTWKHLGQLENLYMDSLSLEALESDLFSPLLSLKTLSLRGNKLSHFPLSVVWPLLNLTHLDLSYNDMESFDDNVFTNTEFMARAIHIDINNNPFQCRCGNLAIFQMMLNHSAYLINFHSVRCQLVNNTSIRIAERFLILLKECETQKMELKGKRMQQEAKKMKLEKVGYSSGIVVALVVLVVVIAIGYKQRSRLARCLRSQDHQATHHENNIAMNPNIPGEDIPYEYDAFVAHNHQEDYYWVVNTLFSELEEKRGLKLCLGQRDFTVGHPIIENIAYAVQNSRHTIVVLTPAFLTSQWCETELQLSLTRGLRHPIVIILDKEVLTSNQLSESTRQVMKTSTYMEYPDSPFDQGGFWDKLAKAAVK